MTALKVRLLCLLFSFAGAAYSLEFATPSAASLTLTPDQPGRSTLSGRMTVTLENPTAQVQRVRFEYVLDTPSRVVPLTTRATCPAAFALITPRSLPLTVPANGTSTLTFTVCAPQSTRTQNLSGRLIARTSDAAAESVVQPLMISAPGSEVATTTKGAITPSAVTLNVTRFFLESPGLTGATTTLAWHGSAPPKATSVRLSSASGGSLVATLTPQSNALQLAVSDIPAAGKYSGPVALDPSDEKSEKVDVTVLVQHFVLWPLLVMLAGWLIAFSVLRSRELDRPRLELLRRIDEGAERHEAERDAWSTPAFRERLGVRDASVLYDHRSDLNTVARDAPGLQDNALLPWRQRLRVSVNDATSAADLDVERRRVDAYTQVLALWLPLQHLYGLTADVLQTARATTATLLPTLSDDVARFVFPPLGDVTPPTVDVREDPTALQTYKNALEARRQALVVFQAALDTLAAAHTHVAKLSVSERSDAQPTEKFLDEFAGKASVDDLRKALQGFVAHIAKFGRSEPSKGTFGNEFVRSLAANSSKSSAILAVPEVIKAQSERWAAPTGSAALRALIRRRDGFDLTLTVSIAATAGFVALYSKGTFGSVYDYLTAFALGASGPLLGKGVDLTPILPWRWGVTAGTKSDDTTKKANAPAAETPSPS